MKNTKQELFTKADYYKNLIDTKRPFDIQQLKEVDNYFRTSFTNSGQEQAYDYMLSLARTEQTDITEELIKRLHYLIYQITDQKEAGQYRSIQDNTEDTEYVMPKAEDIPHFMEHFMNQIQSSRRFMHPIEFAAICHKRLIDIHPFKDGNGRTARLLMNFILINAGYGVISIPTELQDEYMALVLSLIGNKPDIDEFIEFVAVRVIEAEKEYCRLLSIIQ